MSPLEREIFEEYMEGVEKRIMARFDRYDKLLKLVNDKEPKMIDGEVVFDNQELSVLLKVTKRTLQRYRSLKVLHYYQVYGKTYYKESDVHEFIKSHFNDFKWNNRVQK